jgi:hypothetical protein
MSASFKLLALCIRRSNPRSSRSFSLIVQRLTKTSASWNELIRTGVLSRGSIASNSRGIPMSLTGASSRAFKPGRDRTHLILARSEHGVIAEGVDRSLRKEGVLPGQQFSKAVNICFGSKAESWRSVPKSDCRCEALHIEARRSALQKLMLETPSQKNRGG